MKTLEPDMTPSRHVLTGDKQNRKHVIDKIWRDALFEEHSEKILYGGGFIVTAVGIGYGCAYAVESIESKGAPQFAVKPVQEQFSDNAFGVGILVSCVALLALGSSLRICKAMKIFSTGGATALMKANRAICDFSENIVWKNPSSPQIQEKKPGDKPA